MTELPFTHIIPDMASSELVLVESGTFIMGHEEYLDALHLVTIKSFAIGKFPVTQELWVAVMGCNPSYFIGLKRPVEQVSWFDAQAFLQKINQAFQLKTGQFFRLPTEAEWEYVAKGGIRSKGFSYAGSDNLDDVGWYDRNSRLETKEVGLKQPNELGVFDMSGNVSEWCEDQRHFGYEGAPIDGSAWVDLTEDAYRVFRGGSWDCDSDTCLSFYRQDDYPSLQHYSCGFRIALDLTLK